MKPALLLLLCAAPAWAQSKRYPPAPVDVDKQERETSKTWDSATHPDRTPYHHALAEARALSSDAQRPNAIAILGEAIKLEPNEPEAYRDRGTLYLAAKDWAKCADDLQAADERSSRDDHTRNAAADRRQLGLCQGRAGRLAAAEHTLAQAAAVTGRDGELWMRLGEVRIAMGKLDEAISALQAAIDATDQNQQAMIHWLLAAAYDRARRPSEADAEVKLAANYDRSFSTIITPAWPLIGAGEMEYLLGLAYSGDTGRPEYSLLYFRHFLKLAPDSPWHKRAEEHVKELRGIEFPESINKRGAAPADPDALRNLVRKGMPAMRACLAQLPRQVFEIRVTKAGPHTPENVRDRRPRSWGPPGGVSACTPDLANCRDSSLQRVYFSDPVATPQADLENAARCLEPLAEKLPLPAVKEADSWYVAVFSVVSP